jgi:hypothetical protein
MILRAIGAWATGHYTFGNPWPDLLADYDLRRGRIWVLVLVVTLLAPMWASRVRGPLGPASRRP